MNGRVYGISPDKSMVAIGTEVHGYTIVELVETADLRPGDEISWDSDLNKGAQTFRNDSTGQALSVFVHNHLVSASAVRQQLLKSSF